MFLFAGSPGLIVWLTQLNRHHFAASYCRNKSGTKYIKIKIMANDQKGKPSGINKSEGTGIPHKLENKDLEKDKKLTEKYTDDDTSISDNVQHNNPNRNVDKDDATSTGGHKN